MAIEDNVNLTTPPDLSMAAPNAPVPPPEVMAPPMAPPNVGGPDRGIDPTQSPAPPATPNVGGHSRLLAMVHGLSIGLSAAATSMATGGREGGAQEVVRIQGEEQAQKQAAQQVALAQKNAELQHQILTGNLNHQTAMNHILLATVPDEIAKSHLDVQGAAQTNIGRAQDIRTKALQDLEATGDLASYNTTLRKLDTTSGAAPSTSGAAPASAQTPNVLPGVTPATGAASAGTAPTAGAPAITIPPVVVARWKNATDSAVSAYPNDSQIQQYRSVLADPKSTPSQMALAANGAQNRMSALDVGVKSRTGQQAADPLYKLESDPNEITGDKAPAAVALLSSKLADPNLSPDQKPRVQRLLNMANQAQANALKFDEAKERTKQTITDGDPKAAGALLQSGLVSPGQLISSRKPQFAQQAFDEAIRLGGGTKDATGKWTGGTWSAVKAEAQYDYAKNPKTQNTLNLLTTMQNPGGSIDIAQRTFNTIPGKVDVKAFNKILAGAQTQFGGTSTVAFQAAMTSLADEYAQVLQGGAATETTLKQAHDLIQQAYTKNQGAAAFDTIRADMGARQKGMVRDNPALMSMYPNVSAGITVTDPRGVVHTFLDQASADKFKTLAGIK